MCLVLPCRCVVLHLVDKTASIEQSPVWYVNSIRIDFDLTVSLGAVVSIVSALASSLSKELGVTGKRLFVGK